MRNEVSTWALYMPDSLSRMTWPNQPNTMKMMIATPSVEGVLGGARNR